MLKELHQGHVLRHDPPDGDNNTSNSINNDNDTLKDAKKDTLYLSML